MKFNRHSELEGRHAFLSASKYHWINYTPEKMLVAFDKAVQAARGTELHDIAHKMIKHGLKMENTHQTMNMYVNDCIGYGLKTEQTLVYSLNAFGTADAIDLQREQDDSYVLRIFDLKTGETPASGTQLKVYAALFCLEYQIKRPMAIGYDLRLYQNDKIEYIECDPEEIVYIMDRIKEFDKLLELAKEEG